MVYVVLKTAKDVSGNFFIVTMEKLFNNRQHVKQYFLDKPAVWEQVVNNFECYCERAVYEVSYKDEIIFIVIRVDKEATTEFVSIAVDKVFETEEEATIYLSDKDKIWNESINNIPCICERAILSVEL